MHPIVFLYVLFLALVAWLLYTQVFIPSGDRRLPLFPLFRPSARRTAERRIANEEILEAREQVSLAQARLEQAHNYYDRMAGDRELSQAQARLRRALEAAEQLGMKEESK